MNRLEIIFEQTKDAYNWTNRLLDSIPTTSWDTTPSTINSNITWQTGHLIVSFYYHSIMVISGHQMDILKRIPIKNYDTLFTSADPKNAIGQTAPNQLWDHLILMQNRSLEIIGSMSETDLDCKLEPGQHAHPIAKNKFEALDWNIKHTMWHCGQMSIIKRIINERYDFGLQKKE